jgi:membrane protease YdiL (CAAX protease family)
VLAGLLSVMLGFAALLWWRPGVLTGSTDLLKDGSVLSFTTLVSTAVQVGVLALAARLAGWPVRDYLGLVRPRGRDLLIGLGCLALFLPAFDALTYLLGKDIVTPFQVDTYRSARESGDLPLLWLTLVAIAPAGEEIVFRGFLFRGWVRPGRAAPIGIVAISALFAIIHVQYDWFGIAQVLCVGLLLGWMRWRSGSTLLTMLMHAITNLVATLETAAAVAATP